MGVDGFSDGNAFEQLLGIEFGGFFDARLMSDKINLVKLGDQNWGRFFFFGQFIDVLSMFKFVLHIVID